DRAELAALLGPEDAEAVRLEPARRRAVDDLADRELVDAVVVPVDQVVEIVEPESEGAVLRLVGRAGGVAALAPHPPDAHAGRAGWCERRALAGRGGGAVAGRAGVEFQEKGLALHLGVTGQPLVAAEAEQVLPDELAVVGVRHLVALVAGPLELGPQGGVVDG